MISVDQARQLLGAQIVDTSGENVGTVKDVYLNDRTGEPSWISVATGWFGHSESLLPLDRAEISIDQIRVPFDKPTIKNAPRCESGVPLSSQDEDELYRHYGIPADAAARVTTDQGANTPNYPTRSRGSSDASEDRSTKDGAQIRWVDQLDRDSNSVPPGRTRLRKYVITEQQTITVPVSHEVAHLEREPIDDQDRDRASSGVELTEEEIDIVLHAERPVVSTESVPVERVRLDTQTVTGDEEVRGPGPEGPFGTRRRHAVPRQ